MQPHKVVRQLWQAISSRRDKRKIKYFPMEYSSNRSSWVIYWGSVKEWGAIRPRMWNPIRVDLQKMFDKLCTSSWSSSNSIYCWTSINFLASNRSSFSTNSSSFTWGGKVCLWKFIFIGAPSLVLNNRCARIQVMTVHTQVDVYVAYKTSNCLIALVEGAISHCAVLNQRNIYFNGISEQVGILTPR